MRFCNLKTMEKRAPIDARSETRWEGKGAFSKGGWKRIATNNQEKVFRLQPGTSSAGAGKGLTPERHFSSLLVLS